LLALIFFRGAAALRGNEYSIGIEETSIRIVKSDLDSGEVLDMSFPAQSFVLIHVAVNCIEVADERRERWCGF